MATLRTLIEHQTAYAEDCNFNFNALNNESATTTQAVSTLSSTVGGHTTSINSINGSISTINGNIETINTKITSNSPIGQTIWFTGSNVPTGYLLCDGTAKSRTDYADLFAVIGTTYGEGDGSTTFNLPNLINKFIKGSSTPGTSTSSITTSNVGNHTHSVGSSGVWVASGADGSHDHTVSVPSLTLLPCIKY